MEMCVEGPLLEFIGERWAIAFSSKKVPKAPLRLIRPMNENGWRPVTDENPINCAPPTINSLIVRCCKHDASQRPSFEMILNELYGVVKEEVDKQRFHRKYESEHVVDMANLFATTVEKPSTSTSESLTEWVDNPLDDVDTYDQ
eukprot:CAMPEP_0114347052 /NCGR_PEP_ID=MMETSP0101-20121206/13573_1 /TAXON_ID=38822 ORGANISM="Pteridomonas danica, Strain PT" /NCGR_SAMPLE_ID=MMETSP0101 /ASSEMBLY_ACC=CAM_ASM_000211 /LENGTH=143 /DNA_ID=CAMNT_0001484093 /DNA_START=1 /DNA_END=432 /DNA_ORIENTATION=+